MKLGLNAREIVLLEISGLGLIIGQIQYNRQTETAMFVLEKAQYFDILFPCAVLYDNQHGPIVRPHLLTILTTSTIRINRNNVSCFIMENDINEIVLKQYSELLMNNMHKTTVRHLPNKDDDDPNKHKGGKIINLKQPPKNEE
jgi:hypothetical protein